MTPYRYLIEHLFWRHAGVYVHDYKFVCPRCGGSYYQLELVTYSSIADPKPHFKFHCNGTGVCCDFEWDPPEFRLPIVPLLSPPKSGRVPPVVGAIRDHQSLDFYVSPHRHWSRTSKPRWEVLLVSTSESKWTPYIPEWARRQILLDLLGGRNWIKSTCQ